jgi:cystathionine gamma-synthase
MQGGGGGMLSLLVRGAERAAIATAARVRVWKQATSLGDVGSLLPRAPRLGRRARSPAPPNRLRLSAGVEEVGDLLADLDQAPVGAA